MTSVVALRPADRPQVLRLFVGVAVADDACEVSRSCLLARLRNGLLKKPRFLGESSSPGETGGNAIGGGAMGGIDICLTGDACPLDGP